MNLVDCFSEVGISTNTIADALISSSTHVSSMEAHKGRLNMESIWEACQSGSCTPTETSGNKPWIQVCLSSVQRFTSIIVQGPGNFDDVAKVTEFSLKFGSGSSGPFQSYNIDGSLKVAITSVDLIVRLQQDFKHKVFPSLNL